MTIWRMHVACRIIKATNTHSEYVILIAFSQQQWLNASALILGYTYIACLVNLYTRMITFVALTIQPLYTWGNNPPRPLSRGMGKPRSQFGPFGGEDNFFFVPLSETRNVQP